MRFEHDFYFDETGSSGSMLRGEIIMSQKPANQPMLAHNLCAMWVKANCKFAAEDLRDPYQQGQDAFASGRPITDNPYGPGTPHVGSWARDWQQGWEDAQRKRSRNKSNQAQEHMVVVLNGEQVEVEVEFRGYAFEKTVVRRVDTGEDVTDHLSPQQLDYVVSEAAAEADARRP